MNEIKLLKEIGKHQNVLSFLGCWTASEPLLLIIEYIAHGDLLHWLRRKRSQVLLTSNSIYDTWKEFKAGIVNIVLTACAIFCEILQFCGPFCHRYEIRPLRNHYQSKGSFFQFFYLFYVHQICDLLWSLQAMRASISVPRYLAVSSKHLTDVYIALQTKLQNKKGL